MKTFYVIASFLPSGTAPLSLVDFFQIFLLSGHSTIYSGKDFLLIFPLMMVFEFLVLIKAYLRTRKAINSIQRQSFFLLPFG